MKFYIASDHAGFETKNYSIEYLKSKGHEVIDLGPLTNDRVDYPDFAKLVAKSVLSDSDSFGILVCGTGIGMSMTANKFKGIRAALCYCNFTASMARSHNDANVLCYGQRVVGVGQVESILDGWCESSFEGGRHSARVEKIEN